MTTETSYDPVADERAIDPEVRKELAKVARAAAVLVHAIGVCASHTGTGMAVTQGMARVLASANAEAIQILENE
jgi:coenzyme F420-reducing hydrogenase gamma subunit